MTDVRPFTPAGNGVTVSMAVTDVSSFVQFDNILPGLGGTRKSRNALVSNAGPNTIYIEFVGSSGNQTASTATGVPLFPNTQRVFTAPSTCLAAVTAGTDHATVFITPGEGI